jgi:hypothetical protein
MESYKEVERNGQDKRRVKDGKPGCGKKWLREASKHGKREGLKQKCQSEMQKLRRSKGKRNTQEKCKRWKSRRGGGKKYPQRSIKDGELGREKRNAEEKHKR